MVDGLYDGVMSICTGVTKTVFQFIFTASRI
jgi:hypothetical protein